MMEGWHSDRRLYAHASGKRVGLFIHLANIGFQLKGWCHEFSVERQKWAISLVSASQEHFSHPKEKLATKSEETMTSKYPLKPFSDDQKTRKLNFFHSFRESFYEKHFWHESFSTLWVRLQSCIPEGYVMLFCVKMQVNSQEDGETTLT